MTKIVASVSASVRKRSRSARWSVGVHAARRTGRSRCGPVLDSDENDALVTVAFAFWSRGSCRVRGIPCKLQDFGALSFAKSRSRHSPVRVLGRKSRSRHTPARILALEWLKCFEIVAGPHYSAFGMLLKSRQSTGIQSFQAGPKLGKLWQGQTTKAFGVSNRGSLRGF